MAKINAVICVHTEYRILFIPFADYKRVGDISIFRVFGFPVYRKMGSARNIMGINIPVVRDAS